ncbi:MAG: helix-turn-helix transcriptional regulator [Phyllobacteriaceae bacterium]|nr:helix-turn-helix transcriptional regulator [Phyllobacteriaceae bacterium]
MERARSYHERLWAAIDAIAARHGLSPSGLARRAGLDATAFNKSKRFTPDGRPRWPSTESVAKILVATGCDLVELVRLVDLRPLCGTADATTTARLQDAAFPGFHDDGGAGERALGSVSLQVGDHGMTPFYRKGDVLIVSAEAAVLPGDRVLMRVDDGPLEAGVFLGREPAGYRFEALGGGEGRLVAADRLTFFARILWASQ